jgi:hypothetical protein
MEASDWSMRNYCLHNERRELVVFVLHSHSFCSFFFIELSSFRRFYLTLDLNLVRAVAEGPVPKKQASYDQALRMEFRG